MARALIEQMVERGSGHMVFIASLAGKAASPRSSLYNATKFGLRGFALGLRADLASKGVGVSVVSPGFVRDAGMFAEAGAKPPPGFGTTTPERVGEAVVRAIEANKMEIAPAPIQQRIGAHFALAPGDGAARPEWGVGQRLPSPPSSHRGSDEGAENERRTRSVPARSSRSAAASTRSTGSTRCRNASTSPACPIR